MATDETTTVISHVSYPQTQLPIGNTHGVKIHHYNITLVAMETIPQITTKERMKEQSVSQIQNVQRVHK